jgi:hypothetical protein
MNASLESGFNAFDPVDALDVNGDDAAAVARMALVGVARAGVVNRTHRVVRQRAQVMQARRSRVRGLMAPLTVCSVLLILTAAAVWSGLYQSEAAEAAEMVQADVAALAASDATNHLLVALLWFAPVVITVLGMVVLRRLRSGADRETAR